MPLVDPRLLEVVDPVIAGFDDRSSIADELPALARVLQDQPRLRTVLSDVFVDPPTKLEIVRAVVGDQIGEDSYAVLEAIFSALRLARDARRSVEGAAIVSVLALAGDKGALVEVEDEVFRFARLLRGGGELRYALTDISLPRAQKHKLIDELLGGKATDETVTLVKLVVDQARPGDISDQLYELTELAAARRHRKLAEVRTAVELDAGRRRRLAAALAEATGHEVELKSIVDPSVVGGVVARVGDEILDGSVRRNLQQALFRLTR